MSKRIKSKMQTNEKAVYKSPFLISIKCIFIEVLRKINIIKENITKSDAIKKYLYLAVLTMAGLKIFSVFIWFVYYLMKSKSICSVRKSLFQVEFMSMLVKNIF